MSGLSPPRISRITPPKVALTTPIATAMNGPAPATSPVDADDAKQREPGRVEPEQHAIARLRDVREEEGRGRNADADREIDRLAHPEHWQCTEHRVAQRAAAHPGRAAE